MKFVCKVSFWRNNVENEPRLVQSLNFDDEAPKSLVESNPQQSTCELAKILKISQSTKHLEKMEKFSKLSVWIPHTK